MVEKQLVGPNITFSLSGMLDHNESKALFGIGFNVNM
jgi:hypothetical protein